MKRTAPGRKPLHWVRKRTDVAFSFPYPLRSSQVFEGMLLKFILWIVVGGLIGWFASMIMGTNVRQRILLNVLVGIAGAFLGGWVLDGRLGSSIINQGNFSASGLVVPLLGASILLAFVRLVRGSATHSRRREN